MKKAAGGLQTLYNVDMSWADLNEKMFPTTYDDWDIYNDISYSIVIPVCPLTSAVVETSTSSFDKAIGTYVIR